ncbi:MAG: helix-turn-helix transcriptional regulator [Solirubrobacteraceae bacterium]
MPLTTERRLHQDASRRALLDGCQRAFEAASAFAGIDLRPDIETTSISELVAYAELALEIVVEHLEEGGEHLHAGRVLLALHRVLAELEANLRSERITALGAVTEALVNVRHCTTKDEVIHSAPTIFAEICGFDRSLLFTIAGDALSLEAAFDIDSALRQQTGANYGPLSSEDIESVVITRRVAVLADRAETCSSLLRALDFEDEFVAAPIIIDGAVRGLLTASRAGNGRAVQIVDRDVLATFAGGLGGAIERSALAERLSDHRRRLERLTGEMTLITDDLSISEVQLRRPADHPPSPALLGDRTPTLQLTPREREVIEVLCTGATNLEISKRLFISEETVKSHVKQLLKKLGAANRLDAVARYLRMTF